ncbi:hypothetical protein [Bifidobacterium choloepi]|uniref:YolD-like family protein n=1 Tax=Bifidobacterium choloepi TaxID=2614131 RepID=A0A6I5MYS9_9BIFI|nr:hypothetical protein [Bifidobacterium choloepi]NEG69427.1 hypothetical protein [Bifidobacterium choloepi]
MLDESTERYGDIIDLPHHRSRTRPHMTVHNRAAQFMPFAALRGFDDVIDRQTSSVQRQERGRLQPGPDDEDSLNGRLVELLGQLEHRPWVTITHFQADGSRGAGGGDYVLTEGIVRRFDAAERVLVMDDDSRIPLSAILALDF